MAQFSSTDELTSFAGALADQYAVEREIGRGGMGVVYLARDLRLDRAVAIKTLPPSLAGDAAIRDRFLREARTAARLSHPNIVPIHRADEVGDQVFFVMGFVDGDSLAAKLARDGPFAPRDALPILRDVASALGYAHASGVVHRDVKTENILLDARTGRAMVTDFGIARVAEAAPLTATGQVLGTVYYLSPEQVTGGTTDARSDIYALGVVAYVMLAGQFPFDGLLASAVLVAHVNDQPLPLGVAAPNVPASLASIVDRCLAKNPAYRFQSCADLDSALAAAQSDVARYSAPAARAPTPLVSDTEAHVVLKRAAELQDMTGVQPRPAFTPLRRDAERDAARTSGFKTKDLREAATEAGIDDASVQRALAERGLREADVVRPDRRPRNVVFNLSQKAGFLPSEPTKLLYEIVLDGEMPEQDYDLLIDSIKRHMDDPGMAGTVGRILTWTSKSGRGRNLEVTIIPRNGRTIIRVSESSKGVAAAIFGAFMGTLGVAGGGGFFANVGMGGGELDVAVVGWGFMMTLSVVLAGLSVNSMSKRRQQALRNLIQELTAQARESIELKKQSDEPRR